MMQLRDSRQDGPFPSLNSRPGSPLPAPSFVSQGASDAASSYHVYHGGDSSVNLLQYPRPTFHHSNSSVTSFASVSAYDGDTMCQTPVMEKGYLEEGDITKTRFSTVGQSINSFDKHLDEKSYHIEKLHKHDDEIFLPPWKRALYRLSPIFTFLACAAYFTYYAYRIHCTVDAQRSYHKVYIMAWCFIAAEGAVACRFDVSVDFSITDKFQVLHFFIRCTKCFLFEDAVVPNYELWAKMSQLSMFSSPAARKMWML